MKTCPRCEQAKDDAEFGFQKNGILRAYCRPCYRVYSNEYRAKNLGLTLEQEAARRNKNRDHLRAKQVAWRRANPQVARDWQLRRKYGISWDSFLSIVKEQGGGCALCGSCDGLVVDHCHSSGKVRGVLCRQCNCAIGLMQDSTSILARAIIYLEENK